MMPVVAGEVVTRKLIMLYAALLLPLSLLPCLIPARDGGAGPLYGWVAGVCSSVFLAGAIRVGLRRRTGENDTMKPEKQLFAVSIIYLFALFAALVAAKWIQG